MRKILPFIGLFFYTQVLYCQTTAYFQQEVNYKIRVSLDDKNHVLHAFMEMEYINNSPHALSEIYIHLWPNAYSSKSTGFARQQLVNGNNRFFFSDPQKGGFIDSLDFRANGSSLALEVEPEDPDIARLILNEPLPSGGRIVISTPFRVKIPDSFSRLGHIGNQYQITQWYPKPGVYDKNGWHPMYYLDQGEFYSEFGTFEVEITLPANYVVGATGNLQNEAEWEYMLAIENGEIERDLPEGMRVFPPSSEELKTLRYVQDRVHDFAWFADKRYEVRTGEVILPHSGRSVRLIALYNQFNEETWEDIIEYMHDGTHAYSEWIGDYPYDVVTVVDGALSAGAGMEYPTITVLGAWSKFSLEQVTVHEIGHNWFYGILASNERRYPWIDEGINSYYEMRYLTRKYPERALIEPEKPEQFGAKLLKRARLTEVPYHKLNEIAYQVVASKGLDQAANLPAEDFAPLNYGAIVYMKIAALMQYLESYLGTEVLDEAMQSFYEAWAFRHPGPEDIQEHLETATQKDLSWLFDDLIGSRKKLDYKISQVKKEDGATRVTLTNAGAIASPVEIALYDNGKLVHSQWVEGFEGSKTLVLPHSGDFVKLDPQATMPDIRKHNDQAATGGILKRTQPFRLKFLGELDDPEATSLYWLPAIGGNNNDHLLLGGVFYNTILPDKRWQIIAAPMYSIGLDKLSGIAELKHRWHPEKSFRRIEAGGLAQVFAGYEKFRGHINFEWLQNDWNKDPIHTLELSFFHINADQDALPIYPESYQIGRIEWLRKKAVGLHYSMSALALSSDMSDFTLVEGSFGYGRLYKMGKQWNLRLYAGAFIQNDNASPAFNLFLSGGTDYLMRSYFIDRAGTSTYFSQQEFQTDLSQGGFRAWVPVSSNEWLASAHFDVDLPFTKFIKPYINLGLLGGEEGLFYGAGLELPLLPFSSIYLPLAGSSFEEDIPKSFREFRLGLRFSFRIEQISPYKFIDRQIRDF